MQCFSQQIVINKCFLLNLEKNVAQISAVIFNKNTKTANSNPLHSEKK